MANGVAITKLLSEHRFDELEFQWRDALKALEGKAEFLLAAAKGLARAGPTQKNRLQTLAGAAEATLKPLAAGDPELARLRWNLLKEAVRGGATPSTPDGFHRLFEDAIQAAYPDSASLNTLLGRFKFREAQNPADGLMRIEKAEKWLPFEVGHCFTMAGRGPGIVVETNYALDSVRVDFEKVKGVSVPIGVAAKGLVALPDKHFLKDKLKDPAGLKEIVAGDPAESLKWILGSFGRPMTLSEVKDAVYGLVSDEGWSSWWTAARKSPQVVVTGSGKNASVEWSESASAADAALHSRFERGNLKERIDLYKKASKRSDELKAKMAVRLAADVRRLPPSEAGKAFEIAVLIAGEPGAPPAEALVPEDPLPLLASIGDRSARERLLEMHARKFPAASTRVLVDWFSKEEDSRTLDVIDGRLEKADPASRELMIDRLLKSPRSGPRAFIWFAQRAVADEKLRARLNPQVLARLLDAISWDELGAVRTRVREMFDRQGLAAIWMMKMATVEEARTFLEALARHHELEPHRRDGLFAASEMRFPELSKKVDETFFATPEAIEAKRLELERILNFEIPENTKGIAIAAAEGDLSENFEYKARRDKQQLLSVRAGKLQQALSVVRALDRATVDTTEVRPGTKVTLEGPSGARTITLLGPWESSPEAAIYSHLSEAGKELLGKTVGQPVTFLGEELTITKIDVW